MDGNSEGQSMPQPTSNLLEVMSPSEGAAADSSEPVLNQDQILEAAVRLHETRQQELLLANSRLALPPQGQAPLAPASAFQERQQAGASQVVKDLVAAWERGSATLAGGIFNAGTAAFSAFRPPEQPAPPQQFPMTPGVASYTGPAERPPYVALTSTSAWPPVFCLRLRILAHPSTRT